MTAIKFNLNKLASELFNQLCDNQDKYGVTIRRSESGATLVDAGLESKGGYLAGEVIAEISLGGYGRATISPVQYGDMVLLSIFVWTDHPPISLLGSQFSGWQIQVDRFSANVSGPGRALALEPKHLYERLQFKDNSDVAVLVLETEINPPDSVIEEMTERCSVSTKNLDLVLYSSKSLTGAVQASARVVEAGLHKLEALGLDPLVVKHAWGYAPIAPLDSGGTNAASRLNETISCAGVTSYTVDFDDDSKLQSILSQATSSSSNMLQEAERLATKNPRFLEILKESGLDSYKINENSVAPAIISLNNARTGKSFKAGNLNLDNLRRSFGLSANPE